MKKGLLIVIALIITSTAFAQNVISLFNRSNQFFGLMEEQKFNEAYAYFDETAKTQISEENLKQLWEKINASMGKVSSLEAIKSQIQGDFFAVTVEGKFEKDDQNFLLVFNKAEKLVGVFMPPKSSIEAYAKPAYADTALYSEQSNYIKTQAHQLAAVITVPKNVKNYPIVVLVHGSGPADMDETVGANKPFKDLAAGLAAKGIASVRYVKRTLIYANEFGKAFTVKEEVLDDANAAIALAKADPGVDQKNIYVFGHSLGGMLAPRLAVLNPDLAGIILAAAPAQKLTDIIIEQNKYMYAQLNDTTEAGKKQFQDALAEIEKSKLNALGSIKPDSSILGLPASYWVDLNGYDQVATAKKLSKQRIFIIQGGNDFQISEKDYNIWNEALGKKRNVKLKLYPGLNHLLTPQTEKGTSSQYLKSANVSADLIDDLATWIKAKP